MAWTTATPTSDQQRKAERFCAAVVSARSGVERCLNTGKAARDCQAWITANKYGAILPSTWNGKPDEDKFTTYARRATLLERYRAGLLDGSLAMRDTPGIVGDLNIVGPVPAPEGAPPVYSLGVIPLLAIVIVGGIVLLAAAITTALGFYASCKKAEEETKRKIADLDLAAAKAGGSVAANWDAFKKTNAEANGGILGALGKNLGIIAVIGGLIALAIIGSKAIPQRREGRA